MRLRNDPLAKDKLQASTYQITNFPFVVDDNWIIELAMGKGEMILEMATQNPDKFYLGIEKVATVALKAAQKAKVLQLKNFKIICHDIFELTNLIQGQVREIWLTFPDPWPKNRHSSRRLTSSKFLKLYAAILKNGGRLRFKTDNDNLFKYTITMLEQNQWQIIYQTSNLAKDDQVIDNIVTGYEQKWMNLHKNINYLEAKYHL